MTRRVKNILQGVASIGQIFQPNHKKPCEPLYRPHKSTFDALKSDWEVVGKDIDAAARRLINVQ
jgi:hypothetical protein